MFIRKVTFFQWDKQIWAAVQSSACMGTIGHRDKEKSTTLRLVTQSYGLYDVRKKTLLQIRGGWCVMV